jgi:alpha-D-ribose 1-methylphosphonate 5-phosphate C-P lyase
MHIYVSILFSQHVKTIDAWSEKCCMCGTAHVDWIGLNLNKAKTTKKQSKNQKNKKFNLF